MVRRTLAVALATALLAAACAGDEAPAVEQTDVLATLADDVIVPAYEDLVDAFDALAADVAALCAEPGPDGLGDARDRWRAVSLAWRRTRPVGVGPAMERRLAAAIGFLARPAAIDELLASDAPVDPVGLESAGAAVKGIAALEVGLFGAGADALATAEGGRRCEYVGSTTDAARRASATVLADWNDGYRDEFVAGMDGDAQSSLDAIVNEVIFRVTELDDQGLRALVEAGRPDELPANRADGPAAFHLAELAATFEGVARVLGDGSGAPRVVDLVRERSRDTAARLDELAQAAGAAMAALPDAVADAFAAPDALAAAQESVTALKVLLATEAASELGVTIGFSDADGDS